MPKSPRCREHHPSETLSPHNPVASFVPSKSREVSESGDSIVRDAVMIASRLSVTASRFRQDAAKALLAPAESSVNGPAASLVAFYHAAVRRSR